MKLLALLSSAAVASAQLVTYPNGAVAPAKTPEVLAAEAAHFAAKGVAPVAGVPAWGYAGAYPYAGAYAGAWNGWNGNWAGYNGAWNGWNGYNGVWNGAWNNYAVQPLVAHPNGAVVPADEPAVVAAKAEHFAAHGLPVAPVAPAVYAAGFPGLVAHPNGALVPAEPADVVAARAEHLAAHA